jgi:hypothetical protein
MNQPLAGGQDVSALATPRTALPLEIVYAKLEWCKARRDLAYARKALYAAKLPRVRAALAALQPIRDELAAKERPLMDAEGAAKMGANDASSELYETANELGSLYNELDYEIRKAAGLPARSLSYHWRTDSDAERIKTTVHRS